MLLRKLLHSTAPVLMGPHLYRAVHTVRLDEMFVIIMLPVDPSSIPLLGKFAAITVYHLTFSCKELSASKDGEFIESLSSTQAQPTCSPSGNPLPSI